MTRTTCCRVLLGTIVTSLLLSAGSACFAQSLRRSAAQNRSVSRPRANYYLDMFRSGYGDYRGYTDVEDAILAPYLRRNRSTASRLPDRERVTQSGMPTEDPAVARARVARAARAGMSGTVPAAGQAGAAPTGVGSVYMQYSHYYQSYGAGARTSRRR